MLFLIKWKVTPLPKHPKLRAKPIMSKVVHLSSPARWLAPTLCGQPHGGPHQHYDKCVTGKGCNDYEVHITGFHTRSPEPLIIRRGKKQSLSETIGSTSTNANSTYITLQEGFILGGPSLIHSHTHGPVKESAWPALSGPTSFLRNGRWKIQPIFYK